MELTRNQPECENQCHCRKDRVGHAALATTRPESHRCVSCGKAMDRVLCFTVCPHCGFNYRIEVCSTDEVERVNTKLLVYFLMTLSVVFCTFAWLLLR